MTYQRVPLSKAYIQTDDADDRILVLLKDILFQKLWRDDVLTGFEFPAFRTAYTRSHHKDFVLPTVDSLQPIIKVFNLFEKKTTFKFKPKIKLGNSKYGFKTLKLARKRAYTLSQLRRMGYNFSEVRMSTQVNLFLENIINDAIISFHENNENTVAQNLDIAYEISRFRENFDVERPQKVFLPHELLINLVWLSPDDLRPNIFHSFSELTSYLLSFDVAWALIAKTDIGSKNAFTFTNKVMAEIFHSVKNSRWDTINEDLFDNQNESYIFDVPTTIKASAINQMLQEKDPNILKVLTRDKPNLSKMTIIFNWLDDFDITNKNWIKFITLFKDCHGHLKVTNNFIDEKIKLLNDNLKMLDTNNQPKDNKKIMTPYDYSRLVATFKSLGKDLPPDLGNNVVINAYQDSYFDENNINLFQRTGVTSFIPNASSFALIDYKLATCTFLKRVIEK